MNSICNHVKVDCLCLILVACKYMIATITKYMNGAFALLIWIKIPNKEINQCICNTHLNIINIVTCRSVLTSLCLKFLSDSCRVQGLAACLLHNSTQFPKTFPPTTLKLTKLLSKSSKFKRFKTFEIFIKMIGKN